MNLLEIHPKKEKDKRTVEFYSSVGIYLAHASDEVSEKVWKTLYDWLADYTTQPENYLSFKSLDEIKDRVDAICRYYNRKHDGEKYELFEKVVQLALLDGRLENPEKERLYELGKMLRISKDEITHTIRRSSETSLSPSRRMFMDNLV